MLPCLPGGDRSHLLGTLVLPTTHRVPQHHLKPTLIPWYHLQLTPVHWHSLQYTSSTRNHLQPTLVLQHYLQPTPVCWHHLQPTLVPGTTDSPYSYLALPTGNCEAGKVRMCPVPKMEEVDTWGRAGTRAEKLTSAISCTSWCGTQTMDLVALALCSGHSPFLQTFCERSLPALSGERMTLMSGAVGGFWGPVGAALCSLIGIWETAHGKGTRGDQVKLCPSEMPKLAHLAPLQEDMLFPGHQPLRAGAT